VGEKTSCKRSKKKSQGLSKATKFRGPMWEGLEMETQEQSLIIEKVMVAQ